MWNPIRPLVDAIHGLVRTVQAWSVLEIKMLVEVQALKDQVAASVAEDTKAVAAINALKAQVSDLTAQVATLTAGAVTAEDKAALVQAASDLKASSATLAVVAP